MQISLIANKEPINKLNLFLTEQSQTLFYYKVMEMMRHRVRYELGLPYEGGRTGTFTEECQPDDFGEALVDEMEVLLEELSEELSGDQLEHQTDEEYENVKQLLASGIKESFDEIVSDLISLNSWDKLEHLKSLDFTKPINMTWRNAEIKNEEGVELYSFTFIFE